ncbi:MAG TPA: pilus assembly protein PilM [Paraburkholderia sp.]|nr:pilus assembly protein PilM [Paraburkholderia sp.]
MYALWIALSMAVITGVYSIVDTHYVQATPTLASASLAQSMAAYRQAAIKFALANPQTSGVVSSGALTPYLAAGMTNALWQVYVTPNSDVAGSTVVIYTTSTSAAPAITGIEQLAFHSALAGVANDGSVLSPGNAAVALPAAIAPAVPNGTPVWIAQAY